MSLPSPQPGALRQRIPPPSSSHPPQFCKTYSSLCASLFPATPSTALSSSLSPTDCTTSGSSPTCTEEDTTNTTPGGTTPTTSPATSPTTSPATSPATSPTTSPATSPTTSYSATSSSGSTVSTTTSSTASSSPPLSPPSSSLTSNNRAATHSNSNTGAIAGGVVGGAVFLACVIVAGILYFRRIRARKRRMAPSAEFMDSVHKGAPPIFRLRSGAEYMASTPDHVGSLPGTPVPFPFMQDPYKDHKIPGMALPDFSARKSLPPPPRPPFSDYHHFHPVYEASEEGVVSAVPSAWQGVEDSHYQPYLQDSYMNPDVADDAAPPEDMRPHTSSGSGHAKDNSRVALIPVRRSVDVP